jgi:predicted RNA methylase
VEVRADFRDLRHKLEDALRREGSKYEEARQRYLKHSAFTWLNRIIILRMAESHGVVKETIIVRPEFNDRSRRERDLADTDVTLSVNHERLAQESLRLAFSEMSTHIPLLFRDNDPYALLFPRLVAYRLLRESLTQVPDSLWREFETLGWAYQYFNSEERQEIRRRMSRNPEPDDIPALNQFYTVDWVVKVLVHNTLGPLWMEAHPGSALEKSLDYSVPIENDFRSPANRLSVLDLKILDPACGSGHFLLGAFDVLMLMWHEEFPHLPKWMIPAEILNRNLFGLDIDLRACQIAAAALYLKARTTYESLRRDSQDATFRLSRVNIVCADIRFTDGQRREDFLEQFAQESVVSRIVGETLSACENAFEMGGLLRIRQPFEKLFGQRKATADEVKKKQLQLEIPTFFESQPSGAYVNVPKSMTAGEIIMRIRQFIREASEARDMGSLLFGLDAEEAVHLVEMLTDKYDVVLMNPPYGPSMPRVCKEYLRSHYPRTHSYYDAAFIEQAVDLCKEGGYVGALTGRQFLFLKSYQQLREEILRRDALPELVLDLGLNVLDEATARYAAFVLRKRIQGSSNDWRDHSVTFFRLLDYDYEEKMIKFQEAQRLAGRRVLHVGECNSSRLIN